MSSRFGGAIVDRRKFIYSLSTLPAACLALPRAFSPESNQRSSTERSERNSQFSTAGQLNVGIVGIGGAGVFYLDRVAQSFNYPCKQIAIAGNLPYLRFSCAEHSVLIANHGSHPSTIREAQLVARDRKSDISRLVSGLKIAFILTNLFGPTDQGVSSVVAEALGEAGVFTVALKPSGREIKGYRSINSLVDVGFEVPLDVIKHEAYLPRREGRGDLHCAAIAQICRVITFLLAKAGPTAIDAIELLSVLRGDGACVMSYRSGHGVDGCLAAFDAASKSLHSGSGGIRTSRGSTVFIEAKPGILKNNDMDSIRNQMRMIARDDAKLHLKSFENENLSSDYRVTILSQG
jgi:cell division GTPase FtsZ